MTRPRLRLISTVALAFALGALGGGWAARTRAWPRRDAQQRQSRLLQLFSRRLDLSADQQAQTRRILEASHARMRALHAQVRPQFEALRAETSKEIRALLTPEQARKFDQMEARFAARRQQRRNRVSDF